MAWTVVYNHEDLSTAVSLNNLQQKFVKRVAVEYWRELIYKRRVFYCYRAEYVRRLALTIRGYSGLNSNWGPGLMQRPVQPKTRLVFENKNPFALCYFFFTSGNRSSTHRRCASRSARASNLRGRCTENPS